MSEQTRIILNPSTIYTFSRKDRWLYRTATEQAARVTSQSALQVARRTYRALRAGGVDPGTARINVWCLLVADTHLVSVDRRVSL